MLYLAPGCEVIYMKLYMNGLIIRGLFTIKWIKFNLVQSGKYVITKNTKINIAKNGQR